MNMPIIWLNYFNRIYHFNNFSTYSLLANIFAVPLTDFVIMPLGIITILTLPYEKINNFCLFLLEKVIKLFVFIAEEISSFSYSSLYISSNTLILAFVISSLFLCVFYIFFIICIYFHCLFCYTFF